MAFHYRIYFSAPSFYQFPLGLRCISISISVSHAREHGNGLDGEKGIPAHSNTIPMSGSSAA
jgi:hypothetical protein